MIGRVRHFASLFDAFRNSRLLRLVLFPQTLDVREFRFHVVDTIVVVEDLCDAPEFLVEDIIQVVAVDEHGHVEAFREEV